MRAVVEAHAAFTAVEQGELPLPEVDEEGDEWAEGVRDMEGARDSTGAELGEGLAGVGAVRDREGGPLQGLPGEGEEGEEVGTGESARRPLECTGRKWALDVAPKVTRAARDILMLVGEYAAAEVVVLLLVGVDARDDLPDDRAVEGGFWQACALPCLCSCA